VAAKVDSFGPLDAKIAIIGEAPGAYEEREGRPFVGPSGTLLRDMLLQVGIDPESVFYGNLCRYRPPGNDLKTWFDDNGNPNDKVLMGLAELKQDLEIVRPNVIVPVGNFPMKLLTRKGNWNGKNHTYTGIGDYRGSILEVVNLVPGLKAVPTYHPAAVLREYPNKAIAKLDLARALRESEFPEIRRPQKTFIIDPRGEERNYWRDWLLKDMTKMLTFDIEYLGGENLLCVGMTTHKDYAIVIHTQNKADIAFVQSILESGIGLNAQNSMFDCSILEWFYGFDILRYLVHDTMLAAHACYVEFPKALDFLVSIYTDQPYYKDMINWKKVAAGEQPISDVLHYNGIDTWTQHDIAEQQLSDDLLDPDFMGTFMHEMSLLKPLWGISKLGVKIDTARLAILKNTLETEAATLMAGLKVMAGREVNPKSGPQVAKFLFTDLGLPILNKTPKGAPKTDDTTLGSVVLKAVNDKQRTGIKLVRESRERLDLISKFCEIELDDDGRMRCHYDPAKTDSGRLSSRKFYPTGRGSNLQNVPRDTRVRSVFVPDTGCLFGYADLMQAESLVVSHITQDPEMLRLHHTPGLDGHAYVAAYLFEKDIAAVDEEERFIGKKCRHALNYLMGWYRLMTLINAETQKTGVSITAAQAKIYVARYLKLHNYLPMWWREVEVQLYKDRTLKTLLNRKRVFYDRIESILPNAVAFIPQGTVADALNIGLIKCGEDELLKDLGFQMLLQVHDAIGYQFPEANVDAVSRRVRELLQVNLYVPKHDDHFTIPVEIKNGYNWGDKSKKDDTNPNGLIVWQGEKVAA